MRELHRLYHLAVDLKPHLPDQRLMRLLPKTWGKIIESGAVDGLGSGIAPLSQLQQLYMDGSEVGVEPSAKEFKSLLCNQIRKQIRDKESEWSIEEYAKYQKMLYSYYKKEDSLLKQKRLSYDDDAPEFATFSSGFPPIDEIVKADDSNPGITSGTITLLGITGTGKSKLALAASIMWPEQSFMFDPENGEARTMMRVKKARQNKKYPNKEAFIGSYTPEEVYEICVDASNSELLLIIDSMHAICGDGDTADSRLLYREWYEMFNALLLGGYCKWVLNTTQVKRNDDGKGISSAAGSRNIENFSSVQLFAEKGDALPGPRGTAYHEVKLYASKTRDSGHSKPVPFVFDYRNNHYVDMLDNYINEDTPL